MSEFDFVIAIDPGKLSGYAVFDVREVSPVLLRTTELDQEELWNKLTHDLDISAEKYRVAVVFEKFLITPATAKNSNAPWSLENIGVIKRECLRAGDNVEWFEQTPAAAKSFVENDRLKALGFWHKGGGGHANDALRHAVLFMVQKLNWTSKDLLL